MDSAGENEMRGYVINFRLLVSTILFKSMHGSKNVPNWKIIHEMHVEVHALQ